MPHQKFIDYYENINNFKHRVNRKLAIPENDPPGIIRLNRMTLMEKNMHVT
jgi:hypothetical protein